MADPDKPRFLNRLLSRDSATPAPEAKPMAIVQTASAAVAATPAAAVSPELSKVMQRIADIAEIVSPDEKMKAALKANDVPAFTRLSRDWMPPEYPAAKAGASSEMVLKPMLESDVHGFKPLLSKIGDNLSSHPRPIEPARRIVEQLSRATELIKGAVGERRDWLVETAGGILAKVHENPHFIAALQETSQGANTLRKNMSSIQAAPAATLLAATPLAQPEKTPELSAVVKQGVSWRDGSAPSTIVRPPFPDKASEPQQELYSQLRHQMDRNVETHTKRDADVIRDTLSEYARQTGQQNTPAFQVKAIEMLNEIGVRAPKAAYPEFYQQHVEAATTAAVGSVPVKQAPAVQVRRAQMGATG